MTSGIHHVAVRVTDLEGSIGFPVQTLATGRQLFSCRGPDGERLPITGG